MIYSGSKFGKWLSAAALSILLIGCGSGGSGGGEGSGASVTLDGTVQLGNLAEADVKIYEVGSDGSLTLKWQERSSGGDELDEIGKFDTHSKELKPDTFYLYEVSGGYDWDADDDGVKDSNATVNRGTIHAVATGKDIASSSASSRGFKVTAVSEMVYSLVAKRLKYDFNATSFKTLLQQAASDILGDIDGDGNVSVKDICMFDPVADKGAVKSEYADKMRELVDAVHNGEPYVPSPDSAMLAVFEPADSPFEAMSVKFSKDRSKMYVCDRNNGLQIVDISDPMSPALLGSVSTPNGAKAVAVSPDGKKAYTADWSYLQVVDLNDSNNPTKEGYLQMYALDIELSADGKIGYVASNYDGLSIVDLNDSQNPNVIGSLDLGSYPHGGTVENCQVFDVDVSKDEKRAYLASGGCGFYIVDISDPNSPSIVAEKHFFYDANGSTYVSNIKSVKLSKDGTKVYLAGQEGSAMGRIRVLGVESDNITELSEVSIPILPGRNSVGWNIELSPDGKKAFVADDSNGLHILDLDDPADPKYLMTIPPFRAHHAPVYSVSVSSDGEMAAIANSTDGTLLFDISLLK